MPKCPFAVWDEISGGLGPYASGPFKIVHHTTEGSSYAGARATFAANRTDPHFTVDDTSIHQHIDTTSTARALRNDPGGSETNRSSAVQIEVVGFAGKPKDQATLQNVARLCRWIESTHGIGQAWPNGFPRYSTNGNDPGGHNRNSTNWDTRRGHYGHSQVPENVHWDPGYTPDEVHVVTPAAELLAGLSFESVAKKAGKPIKVGVRPLVSVLFTGRDAIVVRIRDVRGAGQVARELYIDPKNGLASSHDLLDPGPLPAGGRKLVFDALINGQPAVVKRTGGVVLVHERRGRCRESARITVVQYSSRGKGRRGSCPA